MSYPAASHQEAGRCCHFIHVHLYLIFATFCGFFSLRWFLLDLNAPQLFCFLIGSDGSVFVLVLAISLQCVHQQGVCTACLLVHRGRRRQSGSCDQKGTNLFKFL